MSTSKLIRSAAAIADDHEWKLLAVRPAHDQPANDYLGFVLCRRNITANPHHPYCTHLLNVSVAEGPGYFAIGHYDMTLDTAIEDFCTRK